MTIFWKLAGTIYDLDGFSNNINKYWLFMLANMNDDGWLKDYYNNYYRISISARYRARINNTVPEKSNVLAENLGLSSPEELKRFILDNSFKEEDKKADLNTKELVRRNQEIQSEKDNLNVYKNTDIRKANLILIIGLFILIYLLRALLYFIKSLFAEIK